MYINIYTKGQDCIYLDMDIIPRIGEQICIGEIEYEVVNIIWNVGNNNIGSSSITVTLYTEII